MEMSNDKIKQVSWRRMLTGIMSSGVETHAIKSRRRSIHRTDVVQLLFIISLIAVLNLLVVETSSQYEVPKLQQLINQHQRQQRDTGWLPVQQQTALQKQNIKLSSSIVTSSSSSISTPSVASNPSQPFSYSASRSSSWPQQPSLVQTIGKIESGGRDYASVSLSSPAPASEPLPLIAAESPAPSDARQNGKILDYTQSDSQQFQPLIAQWRPTRQRAIMQLTQSQAHQNYQPQPQPQLRQSDPSQSLQAARQYNYLEPVTQQKERQQQLQLQQASDEISNAERISLQRRVLLIDGRAMAPINEPQQIITTTGVPRMSRQDSIGSSGGSNGSNSSGGSSTGSIDASCTSMRSSSKGLKTLLRNAKNLLAGGLASIEQRAGGLLWFGSNVLATLVPIASLFGLAPSFGSAASVIQSTPADKTNQTSGNIEAPTGKRTSAATALASLINGAAATTGSGGSGGLQGRVEYVMGWLERSIEHLPSFPRLHPQECVKRSICEAHHDPSRYGAIGLTLRLLFPATNLNSTSEMDNMEYKVINKYRHAAGYGLSKRLDNNGTASGPVCKDKYEDCLVSLLEVGQNLVDFFLT